MTLEPSQPATESTPHEPPGENERKTLKPGKGYGLASLLLCLFVPLFVAPLFLALQPYINIPLPVLTNLLTLIDLLCIVGAIVFGVLGRKTEGWLYAYIGLVLGSLNFVSYAMSFLLPELR